MQQTKIGIIGCGVISNTYIRDIQRFYDKLYICACADIQFIIESLDIPDIRVADHAASDNTDLCLLHR